MSILFYVQMYHFRHNHFIIICCDNFGEFPAPMMSWISNFSNSQKVRKFWIDLLSTTYIVGLTLAVKKSVKIESGLWVLTQQTIRAGNCHIGFTIEQESEEISKMKYFFNHFELWIQNFRENHAMNKDYDKNDSFLLENKERNGE